MPAIPWQGDELALNQAFPSCFILVHYSGRGTVYAE